MVDGGLQLFLCWLKSLFQHFLQPMQSSRTFDEIPTTSFLLALELYNKSYCILMFAHRPQILFVNLWIFFQSIQHWFRLMKCTPIETHFDWLLKFLKYLAFQLSDLKKYLISFLHENSNFNIYSITLFNVQSNTKQILRSMCKHKYTIRFIIQF